MKKAKLDTQGRIVIPKSFCKELNIKDGSPLCAGLVFLFSLKCVQIRRTKGYLSRDVSGILSARRYEGAV